MRTGARVLAAAALGAVLSGAGTPAGANEERIHFPTQVALTADAGEPFGTVGLEVRTSLPEEKRKITSMTLRLDGEELPVPRKAYTDLDSAWLERTEIRTETGIAGQRWLYIYLEIPHRTESGVYLSKRVHIAYSDGRFRYRIVAVPVNEREYRNETLDL